MDTIKKPSTGVQIYPATNRSDEYNRRARFVTELNATSLGSAFTSKNTFVVKGMDVNTAASPTELNAGQIFIRGYQFNINPTVIGGTNGITTFQSYNATTGAFTATPLASGSQAILCWNIKTTTDGKAVGLSDTISNGTDDDIPDGDYNGLILIAVPASEWESTATNGIRDGVRVENGQYSYYCPVAMWSGTAWINLLDGTYRWNTTRIKAQDIQIKGKAISELNTGAIYSDVSRTQNLYDFLTDNYVVDDTGLVNRGRIKIRSGSPTSNEVLAIGQPYISTDRRYLQVGDASGRQVVNTEPVKVRTVEGYTSDAQGGTYAATTAKTGHYKISGAQGNLDISAAQGTPIRIQSENNGAFTDMLTFKNEASAYKSATFTVSEVVAPTIRTQRINSTRTEGWGNESYPFVEFDVNDVGMLKENLVRVKQRVMNTESLPYYQIVKATANSTTESPVLEAKNGEFTYVGHINAKPTNQTALPETYGFRIQDYSGITQVEISNTKLSAINADAEFNSLKISGATTGIEVYRFGRASATILPTGDAYFNSATIMNSAGVITANISSAGVAQFTDVQVGGKSLVNDYTQKTGTYDSMTVGTAKTVSGTINSGVTATTQAQTDSSNRVATTSYVRQAISDVKNITEADITPVISAVEFNGHVRRQVNFVIGSISILVPTGVSGYNVTIANIPAGFRPTVDIGTTIWMGNSLDPLPVIAYQPINATIKTNGDIVLGDSVAISDNTFAISGNIGYEIT
jgi:hypothetical protein